MENTNKNYSEYVPGLIEELKKLDAQIPNIKDEKFLESYMPYTIDNVIEILESLLIAPTE